MAATPPDPPSGPHTAIEMTGTIYHLAARLSPHDEEAQPNSTQPRLSRPAGTVADMANADEAPDAPAEDDRGGALAEEKDGIPEDDDGIPA